MAHSREQVLRQAIIYIRQHDPEYPIDDLPTRIFEWRGHWVVEDGIIPDMIGFTPTVIMRKSDLGLVRIQWN